MACVEDVPVLYPTVLYCIVITILKDHSGVTERLRPTETSRPLPGRRRPPRPRRRVNRPTGSRNDSARTGASVATPLRAAGLAPAKEQLAHLIRHKLVLIGRGLAASFTTLTQSTGTAHQLATATGGVANAFEQEPGRSCRWATPERRALATALL